MFQDYVETQDSVLDLSGLRCPVPVLKFKKHVKELQGDWCISVKTTDPDSVRDFEEFARLKSYQISYKKMDDCFLFTISSGEGQ